ncbi:MAG TPA: tyrosine-type recombinase/integrase [Nannocystaceae bacterium]|nr:tyrosine-type recombinase/integrase [Nannocystaceae bacterium]
MQTDRGATQYLTRVRAELRAGTFGKKEAENDERDVPTLAVFTETFIETYAKTNNEESTVREKQRTLRRAILPLLGHLRLDQITTREVESYKAKRLATKTRKGKPPAAKTINEELAILGKLLGVAHEWEVIERVPRIKRLKSQAPGFDFLDDDETQRVITAAVKESSPWCAMVPVALLTGLRLGELRGLKWDDVDLVAGRLHVRRSADDRGKLKSPKNGRSRIVDLPRRAVDVLRRHKHLRGPFVFCLDDGSMLQNWHCDPRKRRGDTGPLPRICRRAGLRCVGWHVLRHSYASRLMARGAKPIEVRDLLGHSSLNMTNRYAHLAPSSRRAAVALLDEPEVGQFLVKSEEGETRTRS